MKAIEKLPFVPWLESAVKDICENPPDSMLIMAYRENDGAITTFCYDVKNSDMALFQQELRLAEIRQFIRDNPEEFHGLLEDNVP